MTIWLGTMIARKYKMSSRTDPVARFIGVFHLCEKRARVLLTAVCVHTTFVG